MSRLVEPALLEKVLEYKMPEKAFETLDKHKPLILVGTTGAGKNTVAKYIEENSDWQRMVTTTTRPPREGEVNGKDYWFVNDTQIEKLIDSNAMIEANNFPKGSSTIYGTSLEAYESVIKSGHDPMLLIDINGTQKLVSRVEDLRPFFILPPSFEEWVKRLEERGTMTHVEKTRRFRSAVDELNIALKSEKFLFVINKEIPQVGKEILADLSDAATQHHNRELAKRLLEEIEAHHF